MDSSDRLDIGSGVQGVKSNSGLVLVLGPSLKKIGASFMSAVTGVPKGEITVLALLTLVTVLR